MGEAAAEMGIAHLRMAQYTEVGQWLQKAILTLKQQNGEIEETAVRHFCISTYGQSIHKM